MPFLHVNLDDRSDIEAGLAILMAHQTSTPGEKKKRAAGRKHSLAQAMTIMKTKKIWKFLIRVASLNEPEYSLPELGTLVGLSTNKVCSLKAILAKPEQRLGIQFFELAPNAAGDSAGNPRYRMPKTIRQAILDA